MSDPIVDEFRSSTARWLVGSFSGWLALLLSPVLVGLVLILMNWWRNIGTRYELTAQRLVIHRGIVMKSIDEVELYRVKDVRVDYSLLNQLVDIGTITITSSDPTTGGQPLVIPYVPQARKRRDYLRHRVDEARQRRRVREVDIDYEG